MYIITKNSTGDNEILILHYENEQTEITYNNCFNHIMEDIEAYKESDDDKLTIQIIDKLNMHVFKYGYLGKYLSCRYEIHIYE